LTAAAPVNAPKRNRNGLTWKRYFTRAGVAPFDELQWETRSATITNEKGETVFEQHDVEIPTSWSQVATNVVVSKYFRGVLGTPDRERSVKQLIGRVVRTIHGWAVKQGYFATPEAGDIFRDELAHLLVHQKAAFNSPVWFNVGIEPRPQMSACQPYDALVSTPKGMIPIGELVESSAVGQVVYDADGTTRIQAVKANGQKPVRRVLLRNGSFIEATPDHVVRAVRERRTESEWLQVQDLQPGMRLHLLPHRARVTREAGVLLAASSYSTNGSVVFAEDMAPASQGNVAVSEAALAGWLQADGFVGEYPNGTNRSLTIEFQVANDDELNWVLNHLDVALPGVHRLVVEVQSKDPDKLGTVACRRVRLYGEVLRPFVDRWNLKARGAAMRVPQQLWTASHDEVVAYLRSLFQADGYVTAKVGRFEAGAIGFAVISERWVEDVQILLGSLGIYSRRARANEKRPDRRDLHVLKIAIGSERARFAELVGFIGKKKQDILLGSLGLRGLKICPNLREEEIVKIEDLGVREVYDIQTESGNYLSNNIIVHNCFINKVEDTMESILTLAKTEGMLFKYGSGTGTNLSPLRSSRELLAGGGTASGPVSFMKGYDAFAGVIKSGGKTRRAAKMVILNVDHPDVVDFINCKVDEERKAWALIEAGYDPSFNGPAYSSIFFQNSNNSVRVTDDYMKAVEEDREWHTIAVTSGQIMDTYKARDLMRMMADAAWACGDPGLQYDTTVNHWHTCPNTDRINASNPCSEYMFLDNTSCNLASINLMKFLDDRGEFDVEAYREACRVLITAQEILVDNASYPTEAITQNSRDFRPLGLGYANLGALLMASGLPYDSDAGRDVAAALTAVMTGEAYAQSARIAQKKGPFNGFAINREPMLRVMDQHRSFIDHINPAHVPLPLLSAARDAWDKACQLGDLYGYRNSQATVIAPTGTIGFMMDCDTTGIEPDIALVKYKKLVGGGMLKIVNQTVPIALRRLGYPESQVSEILQYIDENDTIEGAPHLRPDDLPVFDCAFKPAKGSRSIHYMGHVKMMAAAQPFISGAISKTVNMPEHATSEDIMEVYLEGWRMGLKAIAIYRDNSKRSQPLNTALETKKAAAQPVANTTAELSNEPPRAVRRKLPDERRAITHKFDIQGHEGYITVGIYEDGTPGEIFLVMSKEGSTISGLMDAFATSISLALQYGVPLEVLVKKFAHTRFEPSGFTKNPEIPIAKSITDYIFRWLASKFLSGSEQEAVGIVRREPTIELEPSAGPAAAQPAAPSRSLTTESSPVKITFQGQEDAPACSDCGSIMIRNGTCYKCHNCGSTSGCS
jgi:ribonucleoside-diphosphate reductase alpha chain